MIVVAGALRMRPEDREAYLAGCRSVVEQARAAPGCLDFSIGPDVLDDGRVTVLERWATRAELDRFRSSGPPSEQLSVLLAVDVTDYEVAGDGGPDPLPLPRSIGAPATRALAAVGCTDLRDLTRMTAADLHALHGVGPVAIRRLQAALADHGLTFAP